MKTKLIITLFASLFLLSCKHDSYKQKILGDWELSKAIVIDTSKIILPLRLPGLINYKKYSFGNSDTCYNKIGYFDKNSIWTTQTKYIVTSDSLSIFDLNYTNWNKWKIEKLTKDTLQMHDNQYRFIYLKQQEKLTPVTPVDEIILSTYSGWGYKNDITINKYGGIYYREPGGTVSKYYTSTITTYEYKLIFQAFSNANYLSLNNKYYSGGSDGSAIDVSFVKNGEIIKSINDYQMSSPVDLVSAYLPLEYLHQHLKLLPDTDSTRKPDLQSLNFEQGDDMTWMEPSVQFYLLDLIRKSKRTQVPLSKKYKLAFERSSNVSKVETDGRIYQVTWKKGGQTSYDIGFNFLAVNADYVKFSKKLFSITQVKFPPPLRKYSHLKKQGR